MQHHMYNIPLPTSTFCLTNFFRCWAQVKISINISEELHFKNVHFSWTSRCLSSWVFSLENPALYPEFVACLQTLLFSWAHCQASHQLSMGGRKTLNSTLGGCSWRITGKPRSRTGCEGSEGFPASFSQSASLRCSPKLSALLESNNSGRNADGFSHSSLSSAKREAQRTD